jgi:hypothetical protein
MRLGPMTEDGRQLGVKLGEGGPKGALTGRVGAAPEVAGDGMRRMRKEIAEAECAHRLAVRLPPDLPDTAGASHRRCTGLRVPLAWPPGFFPLKRDARYALPVYYL